MKFIAETNASIDPRGGLITSWSFTSLMTFISCPYHAYLRYHLKAVGIPEPEEGEELKGKDKGNVWHGYMEDYIQGEIENLPAVIKNFREVAADLKDRYDGDKILVEDEWAFDINWNVVPWRSKDAWCRMKLDVFERQSETSALTRDWKTGKKFNNEAKHKKQLQLYNIGALIRYPELEFVEGQMNYLELGTYNVMSATMARTQLARPLANWTEKAIAMTSCKVFRPKPCTQACTFCEYNQPNSETVCEYGVAKHG